ncbi:MAG TPA: sigma-54-dependent Fis family transcriptional regulator [Gammaproteobacteria bacterium]|nr:sigma-54-dependent Fis family transcriptional regulator [Gammaproteobacteria bacterium]
MSQGSVLVVEDDMSLREALCDTLKLAGYPVVSATDGNAALSLLDSSEISLVVSDVQMEPMDGFSLLKKLKSSHPDLPVVLMTAYGTIEKAVQAMREGASDYLVKPFESDALVNLVNHFSATSTNDDSQLIAQDPQTRRLVELARKVAGSDATVMITGESGSGKEVFARFIHEKSDRNAGPFIAINCAAIPENMLEAIIFGYEKGAFTGAYSASPGKFEQANGGTLLLDEISEMSLSLQAKLLRVLQEREVERLGGKKVIQLDVRVLATSNRNLREEVMNNRFREDLFYRLCVFPLHLSPLCARKEDIIPIAERLILRGSRGRKPVPVLSEQARDKLLGYAWPGNVRELDNVIQRALILMPGDIINEENICFETEIPNVNHHEPLTDFRTENDSSLLCDDLKSREQRVIVEVLESVKGSRKAAAEKLGISPRTLRYKLARLREMGIEVPA